MEKEKEIEILMLDGCTRLEAERHLERGSVVFPDFQKNINLYTKELDTFDEKELRKMAETEKPMEDWSVVKDGEKTYFIMYCL